MRTLVIGIAIGLAAGLLSSAIAQDAGGDGGGAPAGGMQPEWTKKTKHHDGLAKSVGTYDVACSMWMAPGAAPMTFAAQAEREMVLGGYFLKETFTCSMPSGPFEGWLLLGYDTVREHFVSVWTDSTSPVMGISHGTMKDGVFTFEGEQPDYMTGKLQKSKSTVAYRDDGAAVWTHYVVQPDGTEHKTMEFVYTPAGE